MTLRTAAFALLALALALLPASAQFYDQRTWAGTSGGSANAQTITIANWVAPRPQGVPLRFKAGFTNTGSMTLNDGIGTVLVSKQTPTGLQVLAGGEIQVGQIYEIVFGGVSWQLLNASAATPVVPLTALYTVNGTNGADCGKFFSAGGTTFYAITLGGPSGSTFPAGCIITIQDADTSRGKAIKVTAGAFGGAINIRQFPGQIYTFTSDGTNWQMNPSPVLISNNTGALTNWTAIGVSQPPAAYATPWFTNTPNLFQNSAFGSDDPTVSDCLATGSGACLSVQNAINILQQAGWSTNALGASQINLDCSDSPQPQGLIDQSFSIQHVSMAGIMNILGENGTPGNCPIIRSASQTIMDVQDGAQATISGVEMGYSGAHHATMLNARQLVIMDINNVIFAANGSGGGGAWLNNVNGSSVGISGLTLNGAANTFVAATQSSYTSIGTPTVVSAAGVYFSCSENAVIDGPASITGLSAGSGTSGCVHP
jgi:hypothetical protein